MKPYKIKELTCALFSIILLCASVLYLPQKCAISASSALYLYYFLPYVNNCLATEL